MENQRSSEIAANILKMFSTEDQFALTARLMRNLDNLYPTLGTRWFDYCLARFGVNDDLEVMDKEITFGDIVHRARKDSNLLEMIAPGRKINPVWETLCLIGAYEALNQRRCCLRDSEEAMAFLL